MNLSCSEKKKISNEIVDTLTLARDKFPGSPSSLDALCKRFRIDNSKRTKHTALIDCELLSKVYINLIDQKEPRLNFHTEEIINTNNSNKIDYCKKIIQPTEDELENYKVFMKKSLKKIV